MNWIKLTGAAILALGLVACTPTDKGATEEKVPEAKTGPGVLMDKKVVRVGTLNDESGPAAAIGKPYAIGKRVMAGAINTGGSGILPDGWKLELIERDHGYNPQRSVQVYNELKDQVLFFATSFGTPPTLPLQPMLQRDKAIAFPASLSSKMANHRQTPPLGPPYNVEAMRAMDWAVEQAGGADKVKAGIIYQQDDYGQDGLLGWKEAAKHHKVTIVSEQTATPGQADFTAAVTALKEAGATHVLLTTLPSSTGPIVGKAAQLKYMPIWIGNTPSWIDRFFNAKVIPPVVFTNFYWVTGFPFWGEDVPGMDKFVANYEKFGKEKSPPDFYILVSYIQGLASMEAFKRALENGDTTREGYAKALQSMSGWDAGGLIQPLDLGKFPYVTGVKTRVLKPVMDKGTWEVAAGFTTPTSYKAGTPTAAAPAAAKKEDAKQ